MIRDAVSFFEDSADRSIPTDPKEMRNEIIRLRHEVARLQQRLSDSGWALSAARERERDEWERTRRGDEFS